MFYPNDFFNICVLPQCMVYWIDFQNINTCTYQKTLPLTLFFMFSKLSKAFSESLKQKINFFISRKKAEDEASEFVVEFSKTEE